MLKNIRKNLERAAESPIFAASKSISGPNAAVLTRPAFFVAIPYRKLNTTTPCRECGNAPGGFANRTLTARSVVFLCLKTISMKQTSISLGSALSAWWHGESRSFTALCGESFTHGEVLLTCGGILLFMAILQIAGWLAGGAL